MSLPIEITRELERMTDEYKEYLLEDIMLDRELHKIKTRINKLKDLRKNNMHRYLRYLDVIVNKIEV
jgi:hypothetical protein